MEEKTTMTKEMVTYVAELSRISLDEAETEKMQDELGAVVAYMDILNSWIRQALSRCPMCLTSQM